MFFDSISLKVLSCTFKINIIYRTHTNGELSLKNKGEKITLSDWVQSVRDKGFVLWIDLRDRYGITQLILDESRSRSELFEKARTLGREFVVQIQGEVLEQVER